MNARELEQAAKDLQRQRRFAVQAATLAGLTVVSAAVLVLFSLRLAVVLAAGAAAEGFLAAAAVYGRRLVRLRERERLSGWIREVIAEAHLPGSLYLADRVLHFARDLEALAYDLASSAARVQPASVVACRRLLTHAFESPLYNPRLPMDDLELALRRIRRGIRVS